MLFCLEKTLVLYPSLRRALSRAVLEVLCFNEEYLCGCKCHLFVDVLYAHAISIYVNKSCSVRWHSIAIEIQKNKGCCHSRQVMVFVVGAFIYRGF